MQLDSHVPIPARLWRTILDDERIAAALIARITYRIVDGRLFVDTEQVWEVPSTPWDSPVGPLPPEDCFRRGGVDLMVFGKARALGGRPTGKVELRVVLGDFVAGVDVYGERLWTRGFTGELRPSEPAAFVERPLGLEYAFGGRREWDGLEVPHPSNPIGKGWYIDEQAAVDQPLANIEDPRRPITGWADHPDPVGVGFCPRGFGPRLQRSVEFDERGLLRRLDPTFFNDAFPDLVAPPPSPGARCAVYGVHPAGPIAFKLPTAPLMARIRIGEREVERILEIEQIGVEADLGRVFISYRFPFRYRVVRMQPRSCELLWSPRAHEG